MKIHTQNSFFHSLLHTKEAAVALGLLVACAMLTVPDRAAAECIEVTPSAWDYGDVEVGSNVSQIFTLESCASTDVVVYIIEIIDDDTGAFSITAAPNIPLVIHGGESAYVEVTFTPSDLGAHEAFLHIYSNAPGNSTYVNLFGVGVSEYQDPEELMTRLLDFFDAAVAEGSLYGTGPPWWATWRLMWFGYTLNWAAALIESGQDDMACWVLGFALKRADGERPPRDLVAGPATEELADMILAIMDALGCE